MTGRARGRARGRGARPQQDQGPPAPVPGGGSAAAAAAAAAPRPQAAPQPAAAAPPPQAPPGNGNGMMVGSGRASVRGGTRGEPRPGEGPPTRQMAGLSLGGATGGRQMRRRGDVVVEEPRTRPSHVVDKTGTTGRPLTLVTNTFRLLTPPNYMLYQYHVTFKPDIQSRGLRNKIIRDHKEIIGDRPAFDGMILFTPRRLDQDKTELTSILPSDGSTVQVTLTLTNELPSNSPTALQVYNIMFRRVLNAIDMRQIQRHYFSPSQAVTIPQHNLEVWPGFITSILQYESSIMLMADINHKILRTNTVLDFMYDLYNKARGGNFYEMATKKLVGEIVLTRYNNKTYRVDDIDWDKKPTSTFKSSDGSDVKFIDYYQKHHNITVTDMDQPLLISRPKKKDQERGQGDLLLLPELCTLTGLSEEVRSDFHVMKDIAVHTRVAPDGRYKTLTKFINQISQHEEAQKEIGRWNLKFEPNLTQIQGRQLPVEKIIQKEKQFGYKAEDADWSKEMRGNKLISCPPLERWIVFFSRRDAGAAQDCVQTLGRVGPPMGMRMDRPAMVELPDGNTQTFIHALRQHVVRGIQLVVCILPSNKKDLYDSIKKFTCTEMAVPSQCILQRTLSKKQMLMSVCTKVAIQLNCKLGGEAWALEIPLKGLMVVGIDTYHDSSKKGRSVGGFIASTNSTLTKYYCRCTFQSSMQELMDGLKVCMKGALERYHGINGSLPERIVVYRDGVGDGQLSAVVDHEVPQMLSCFQAIGQDYNPKTAIVVVKKRINHRFFAPAGNRLSNPPPGTIIDTEVTRPEWFDFYLVSQSVRQGTVTPTHCNVVHDTSGMRPDHIQRLTYKLCHLYYNWPGTIRVPAPCQYAHKLAFLVGQSLHRDPSIDLADKLFFL